MLRRVDGARLLAQEPLAFRSPAPSACCFPFDMGRHPGCFVRTGLLFFRLSLRRQSFLPGFVSVSCLPVRHFCDAIRGTTLHVRCIDCMRCVW